MNSFLSSALTDFFSSFILATCLTSLILQIALRLPVLARPSANRLHVAPTPVWGGVAIFISFTCVAATQRLFDSNEGIAVAVAAGGVFLLGLVDDIWKLRPRWKLLGQIFWALVPLAFVFRHPLTGNHVIDVLLAMLWMIGVTNAFNLLDNINGLSAGTAVLVSSFQAAFFLIQGEPAAALANIAFAGAIIGFLVFNFPTGRIFMGDSGSLFIGFWVAAMTLTRPHFSEGNQLKLFLFPLLVMVVPICDTTLVTLTRVLKGRPVSVGGTDHFSHRLVAYGFSQRSAVLALWILSFLSGILGICAVSYGLNPLLSVIAILLVAVAIFSTYLTRFELRTQAPASGQVIRRFSMGPWARISLRVLVDLVVITAAYYTAYILRFDREISPGDMHLFVSTAAELALIKLAVLVACAAYRPSWDYFGLRDAYRLIGTSALASLIVVTYFSVVYRFYGFSRVVIALDFVVFTLLSLIFRFSFRLFDELAPTNHRTNALIYGADTDGETALHLASKHYRLRIVGFLDDDRRKKDLSIHSVPVRGCIEDLADLAKKWNAGIVLLTPSASQETRSRVSALCTELAIRPVQLHHMLEDLAPAANPSSQEAAVTGLLTDETHQSSPKVLSKASLSR